jgi:putative ATP-binding cassette transporter
VAGLCGRVWAELCQDAAMKLLRLIQANGTRSLSGFAFLAALSGLSNALVLAILNDAATTSGGEGGTLLLLTLVLVIAIYALSQNAIMQAAAREIEGMLHALRKRMLAAAATSDLLRLDGIGRSAIYAGVTRETQAISEAQTVLIVGCQSAILIVLTLLYILLLSGVAFLIAAGFVLAALVVYRVRAGGIDRRIERAMQSENRLFDDLRDLLDGFKEVKMHRGRDEALFAEISGRSKETASLKDAVKADAAQQFVASQAGFFALIGAMIFIVPVFAQSYSEIIVKITTAVLFLTGPIGILMQSIPVFAQANAAAGAIADLVDRLEAARPPTLPVGETSTLSLEPFRRISLSGVQFSYPPQGQERPFAVGPADFDVRSGEIVFLTGGNGSGKSTFLRLLTGLYEPTVGEMRVDATAIDAANRQAYRDLFAAVFSDYHLFRRLYGIDSADPAEVQEWLARLDLDDKTQFMGDRFEPIDLSTGQRKRLALLAAVVEDRPMLVLDELAADLDPAFRRTFYEDILPSLKRGGRTIVAATHDDRYFHVADRRFHLADGRIADEREAHQA